MTDFHCIHTALFDELARQGAMHVDIGRLTEAVLSARADMGARSLCVEPPNSRCANGACE